VISRRLKATTVSLGVAVLLLFVVGDDTAKLWGVERLTMQDHGKAFINLTMPAPWNDDCGWWVLQSNAKSTTVAHNARFHGKDDILVMEVEGDRYRFVGKNGHGITGVEGSLLHAAAQSPDGRLWIMAEHRRFPNQIRGNQFCLFVLANDKWTAVGPRFGAPREHSWNYGEQGLHFFGDNRPVTASIRSNFKGDNSCWQLRLRRLEGDRWVTLPGHEYVYGRSSHLRCVWRANDAWLIEIREKAGQTTLDVRWIKGPRPEETVGPFHLDSWVGKMCFFHFAVSPDGSVAVVGCNGDIADNKPDTPFFLKLYHPSGKGDYKLEEAPYPPLAGEVIGILEWSPTGTLHVVSNTAEKAFVHQFAGGRWVQVGEGTERRGFETTIWNPKLFFRDDGTPIVTWERFITR